MGVQAKPKLLLGIDKLRAEADFSHYLPKKGSPAWLVGLAQITRDDLGTLAILGPSGISIRSDGYRSRLRPDPASLYIAGLTDKVRGAGQKVAVGIPASARHLPLLLATAAVLKSTLERARGSSRLGNVLVISRDLDIRSRYCDVYVQKEMLDDAFPGSRMRPDGEVVLLRKHSNQSSESGGVCFFLPELELPVKVDLNPALVILDFRYSRWIRRTEKLVSWVQCKFPNAGVVALYTIGDQESMLALSQAGYKALPFDHSAIATCVRQAPQIATQDGVGIELGLSNAATYLVRSHTIDEIAGSDALMQLYAANAKLLYDQHKADNPDLNRARWLLAVLSQIPVPLHWYELTARGQGRPSIKRLIELLGYAGNREKGMGAIIQTVRMHLQQLYRHIEQENPRVEALKFSIERASNAVDKVLVLVRDRTMAEALESWLALEACTGADWLRRVEIRGYDTYSDVANHQYQTVLINGTVPRRYRWALGSALGKSVCFLAYPYESEVIERHLLLFYGDEFLKARRKKRMLFANSVLGISGSELDSMSKESPSEKLALHTNAVRTPPSTTSRPIKAVGGFSGLADAMDQARQRAEEARVMAASMDLEEGAEAPENAAFVSIGHPDAAEQDCLCVPLRVQSRRYGRGKIWVDPNTFLQCIRPAAGEEILQLQSRNLRVGDVLLRMENTEMRGSLFDQMVTLAEGQPEMDYLAAFRRAWREAVQRIALRFRSDPGIDYGRILVALKEAGAPIMSEQAVRFWIHDQVIGPEAIESIEAVGTISGSQVLVAQAKHFDKAFRSIRVIHQGIGRRLSETIRLSFRHLNFIGADTSPEKLDERLGIPLDELIETVDLAEILAIGNTTEKKSGRIVNRFWSEDLE